MSTNYTNKYISPKGNVTIIEPPKYIGELSASGNTLTIKTVQNGETETSTFTPSLSGGISFQFCGDDVVLKDGVPSIDDPSPMKIYFIRNTNGSGTNDIFDEWVYANEAWEKVGSGVIDTSGTMKIKLAGTVQILDSDGYVNIPNAFSDYSKYGLVKIGTINFGLCEKTWSTHNIIALSEGNLTHTAQRRAGPGGGGYGAVTTNNFDYAVRYAMCDGTGAAWTDTEKNGAWQRLTIVKQGLDTGEVLVPNAKYYVQEVGLTKVIFTLPTDAPIGSEITVVWYNGETASELTITGAMLDFNYAPSANTRSELSCVWDGRYWCVIGYEQEIPSDE